MGIKLETLLNRLRKLNASKPGNDFVAAGIALHVNTSVTVEVGESVADLMNRINTMVAQETDGTYSIDAQNVVFDFDNYFDDTEIVVRIKIPKTTQQLQQEIDAEINRVEKAIHWRNNPSPAQQKLAQKKQQQK